MHNLVAEFCLIVSLYRIVSFNLKNKKIVLFPLSDIMVTLFGAKNEPPYVSSQKPYRF